MYLILLFFLLLFSVAFFYINTQEGFTTDFQTILPIEIAGDNQTISVPNNLKGNRVEGSPYIAFEGDIRIKKENCLEFAKGFRKEINAGKIVYKGFSDCLDIVGASDAGTGIFPRRVKLYDDVEVSNSLLVKEKIDCRNLAVINGVTVNETVQCKTLNITSDERVKHKKTRLDPQTSLEQVRTLQPTQFEFKNGDKPVYGFLAQEVQSIAPTCITCQKSFIANIYDKATQSGNQLTFKHFKTSDLAYKGSTLYPKLKLMNPNQTVTDQTQDQTVTERTATIVRIVDEHTVELGQSGDEIVDQDILVYGQEVDDFLTIDKNQIFTLTTSALQALDAHQQALDAQQQALDRRQQELNHQQQAIDDELHEEQDKNKTTLHRILQRLSALEAK